MLSRGGKQQMKCHIGEEFDFHQLSTIVLRVQRIVGYL